MNLNLFKQGPMSKSEAEAISQTYSKRGHKASVTPSFDNDGAYYVYIDLPSRAVEPKPSRTFQNKLWE